MSIVASTIIEDAAQVDGRRAIRERHIDHLCACHDVSYMAECDADVEAIKTARAGILVEQLKQTEINSNLSKSLNGETDFTFEHSTEEDLNDALIALEGE